MRPALRRPEGPTSTRKAAVAYKYRTTFNVVRSCQ